MSGEWKTVPPVPMFNIVDVRDLAWIHVLALENEKAGGKRISCASSASVFSHQLIADVIHRLWPEWDGPVGAPGELVPEGMKYFEVGNERSKEIFDEGLEYRSAEDSVMDYVKSVRLWMEKLGTPMSKRLN